MPLTTAVNPEIRSLYGAKGANRAKSSARARRRRACRVRAFILGMAPCTIALGAAALGAAAQSAAASPTANAGTAGDDLVELSSVRERTATIGRKFHVFEGTVELSPNCRAFGPNRAHS